MRTYLLLFFSMVIVLFSCNKSGEENKDIHAGHKMGTERAKDTVNDVLYWCPMDTQVVQNKPGICPICEMDLEPKPSAHAEHDTMSAQDWVYTPANVSVLSVVKSIKAVEKSVPVKIKLSGYISYDERRINSISAKTSGRIENLFVKYNYQPIQKGQALFEIFSHELQTAQEEYLYLKKNDPDADDLHKAAKNKLLLLGMTEGQINKIQTGKHLHATTTVYSPFSGFVIEEKSSKEAIKPIGSMNTTSGMASTPTMEENNKEITIREGAYVTKGESVFKVTNTDIVWGIFEVYSKQLTQLKINQPVHIQLENTEEMILGKINFIEPSYNEGTGTARIRVYLDNKDQKLKIGNILSGDVEAGLKKGLWIPQTAVYDLGNDKIVFIKRNGAFETKKITTGIVSGNEVEILSGLNANEDIAENAQFMVDSESFIKVSK